MSTPMRSVRTSKTLSSISRSLNLYAQMAASSLDLEQAMDAFSLTLREESFTIEKWQRFEVPEELGEQIKFVWLSSNIMQL